MIIGSIYIETNPIGVNTKVFGFEIIYDKKSEDPDPPSCYLRQRLIRIYLFNRHIDFGIRGKQG